MYDPYYPDESDFKEAFYKEISHLVANNKTIYKYVSIESGIKVLANQTLAFGSPLEMNDPYDCYLPLIDLKNVPKSFIKNLIAKYPENFDENTRKDLLASSSEDIYNKMKGILDQGWSDDLSKRRISCFSKTFSNLLMWSHYGDSHSGICIGFDLEKLYKSITESSGPERFLVKAKYEKDFVPMDYYAHPYESVINWLRTKSIDWIYEKEIRIVLYDPDFESGLHIKPIEKNSFVSVFLGSKISKENADIIKSIINKKLPHVDIKKMTLCSDKFEIIPV